MSGRIWWRLCFTAGLIVIAIQLAMGSIDGTEPCGPDLGLPAILAFELVTGPDDVDRLFGQEPCRSRLAAAMDQINMVDIVFIPAFVCFLVFGAVALRSASALVAWLGVATAIVAGSFDQTEDQILLAITADLPGTQSQIDLLYWLVRGKFLLLGIAPILIGLMLYKLGPLEKGLAVVMSVGGLVAIAGVTGQYQLMTPGIAAGWIALLIAATRHSFWPESSNLPVPG